MSGISLFIYWHPHLTHGGANVEVSEKNPDVVCLSDVDEFTFWSLRRHKGKLFYM